MSAEVITILSALGGFELIKWAVDMLVNRKHKRKVLQLEESRKELEILKETEAIKEEKVERIERHKEEQIEQVERLISLYEKELTRLRESNEKDLERLRESNEKKELKIESLYKMLRVEQSERHTAELEVKSKEKELAEAVLRKCNVRGCTQRTPPSEF